MNKELLNEIAAIIAANEGVHVVQRHRDAASSILAAVEYNNLAPPSGEGVELFTEDHGKALRSITPGEVLTAEQWESVCAFVREQESIIDAYKEREETTPPFAPASGDGDDDKRELEELARSGYQMDERGRIHRITTPQSAPVDAVACKHEPLLAAAKNLRAAQRAYMADRGNESLGRAVGERARELDDVIALAEQAKPEDGDSSDLGEVRFPAKGGVWGYGA